ncbi:phage tail protein [Proteus mirabilis]|nr:phage tail protein [Proteus mirabilis]MBG3084488.1 phage tail protein [Proteus mirabilis]MBG5947978.1 phage tail protein [Proteus mirabilis]HEJ9513920.1 phage tail protein [Proteus mirabilis]HEK0980499.1 phage tail protein [Proteus mirabilis]
MANENLSKPIEIQSAYIVPDILPTNFSETYRRIVLSGADDMAKVAGRANEAGAEAFDAQSRNDEQDIVLEDHEERLGEAEQTIVEHGIQLANHEERITKTEEDLSKLEVRVLNVEQDIDGLKIKIQDLDGRISEIKVDYVSLSKTEKQKLLSPIDVSTSYSVNGTKVVGSRVTGFTPATGTALKGSFNASQSYSFSADYTRSEMQTLANGLIEARQRIKALEDALRSHGLID